MICKVKKTTFLDQSSGYKERDITAVQVEQKESYALTKRSVS